jgi:hypothetical protein
VIAVVLVVLVAAVPAIVATTVYMLGLGLLACALMLCGGTRGSGRRAAAVSRS